MSDKLRVEVETIGIGFFSDPVKSYVDVSYRLYETEEDGSPKASVDVRVFRNSDDCSLAEMKDEARRLSSAYLSQIAELVGPQEIPEELRRQWR